MVKAIARVARDLGTETVAEFVTDDATRELVHSYGVHYAQGYGIGRPRPITATWPGAFADRSAAPPAKSVVGHRAAGPSLTAPAVTEPGLGGTVAAERLSAHAYTAPAPA
jgi:predicted signal transduction protein with EAL and GGDEF domain